MTTPSKTGERETVVAGRYEVRATIGHGGMGVVHVAFDRRLERTVALKVPRADRAIDDAEKARFLREAKATAPLNHPNIVTVYDAFIDAGVPYMVMELVDGSSLADTLRAGPMDQERAISIARSVASALAYAHDHGVIHRDVKPSNVMLTGAGDVKVLDFGVAKIVAGTWPTDPRSPIGTAEYLSPEQLRGEAATPLSDIYSLAVVLYEMLAGRPPFTGDPATVMYAHVNISPRPPSDLRPPVSPPLDSLVLRCLAKDPSARPQDARELERELRAAAGTVGDEVVNGIATDAAHAPVAETAAVTHATNAPTMRQRPGPATIPLPPVVVAAPSAPAEPTVSAVRTRRRGRWLTTLVAVGAAAAIGAGAFMWRPWSAALAHPKPPPVLHAPARLVARGSCDGFLGYEAILSWAPSTSTFADGYLVYRSDGVAGPYRAVAHVSGRGSVRYVDHNLGSGRDYYYRVKATAGARRSVATTSALASTPFLCLG